MLTKAQKNIIFTNIETAYTVEGTAYTAFKTWRDYWQGELDTPVIRLSPKAQTHQMAEAIGRRAEWVYDPIEIDVFATTDTTNGVHGSDITESITRELELWFKQSATALIYSEGISIGNTTPVQNMSFIEEGVYRRFFEVHIMYQLL